MSERCFGCGHFFLENEPKLCEKCYLFLEKRIISLHEQVKRYERTISELEAKLAEYEKIIMNDSKLWSELVARKLEVH